MGEQKNNAYGQQILRAAAGDVYIGWGSSVEVAYGAGMPARIDGTVAGQVAVEVESRVSKQVRGAVLDLICHRYKRKLLILLPVHMSDAATTAEQCRWILARFVTLEDFRVIVLAGDGERPHVEEDVLIVQRALRELGCA